MQIFKDTNFDFLGKKWPFITASLVLSVAGIVSLILKGGPQYGIDFRGGALMDVTFAGNPPVEQIRTALSKRISGEISVQNSGRQALISTELKTDQELAAARAAMVSTLEANFGGGAAADGKADFNNIGSATLADKLRDPLQRNGVALSDQQIQDLAARIVSYRDRDRSGLLTDFSQLAGIADVTPKVIQTLEQVCYLAPFHIGRVEVVGPKVGGELRQQALMATLYALGGMLVYIAFRFEWIYGVAAVVAVIHDTLITVGLFSLFNKEITLTVIAALLTLVGYSMNDTIVVFDRIRENLKILRREKLDTLINKSINQTLSRTILTSGLTFLTVLALFLFGGQVLHGFSFALVVGIIIGTYSSIFIASPILVFWQGVAERRKGRPAPPPVQTAQTPRKSTTRVAK